MVGHFGMRELTPPVGRTIHHAAWSPAALLRDTRAVTALEYGLMAALIAFSLIASANVLVAKLVSVDNTIATIYANSP